MTTTARGVIVTLTWAETLEAAMTGVMRTTRRARHGERHRYGFADPNELAWANEINGALGERAAAKALNLPFDGCVGSDATSGDLRYGIQVRTTPREQGCLILHPTDADGVPWVLVTGRAPALEVVGWCFGRDGKRDEFWRTTSRPAYFVPASALRPIQTLRQWVREISEAI
jgi:hypothetical protein